MNDIVLIGKVTGSTPNLVQLEYPSANGVHSVRLPRNMVARFERIANERVAVLVRTDESDRGQLLDDELVNRFAPLHSTNEEMAIVMAIENNEDIPNEHNEETDDEVPVWVAQNDAPLVQAVFDEDIQGPTGVSDGPFNNMLYAGGRQEKASMDWDFDPVRKPAFVMHEEGHQGTTVARVNNAAGEPSAFHIFNPMYQSEKRPAGAYLGTFSASYYPMAYRKGFNAPLAMAAEKDWDKASESLGQKWTQRGFANNGDYRVGIAIYNSLDGSSAFKVQAVAERLVCTNGMVMGDRATLVSLKHTNGVLGNFDFEALGEKIIEVVETAAKEIIVAETMKDIQVDRNTFEKLMTICQRKGLIAKPTVKRNDAGEVTALTRGHMWRLMGQGWTNPSEPWVAVNNKDRGSLYHVYNILTGAVTHKPTWTDGKTVLTGSTLNFSTFTDRLQTVHKVLGDITSKSVDGVDIDTQLDNVPLFSEILH